MESQGFQTTEQKDLRLQVDERREMLLFGGAEKAADVISHLVELEDSATGTLLRAEPEDEECLVVVASIVLSDALIGGTGDICENQAAIHAEHMLDYVALSGSGSLGLQRLRPCQ